MENFRINAQESIINNILEALENSILGQGIASNWDYELLNEKTIEFNLKEGKTFRIADIFWFGYITAID